MFSTLKEVVGVMDMDGFMVHKRFYCKELGLMKVGDVAAQSYFFDLGIRWSDLTEKIAERATALCVLFTSYRLKCLGVLERMNFQYWRRLWRHFTTEISGMKDRF